MKKILIFFTFFVFVTCSLYSQSKTQVKEKANELINSSLFNSFKFRFIGPALTSGRISDIAIHPSDLSTWYIAVAMGNVWKTTNAGASFSPIFDTYGSYSIGCLAIAPDNKHVIWVGTGENNSQRSVGYGDGVYKSIDGGKTFTKVGLERSEHIGKILIDPNNSDIVYVAAQGPLWGPGGDRGLYKTTDGGKTWNLSLKISENTGVTDIVMDSRDSKVLYAASYQRRRHVWTLINGGPESKIYKSTDGGTTWEVLSNGLPKGDVGRIGLAISPQNPDVVYAIIEASPESGGFYKSTDRGASWTKQNSYFSGSAQYYHEIFCDPIEFDYLYSMDTYSKYSSDGGKTWNNLSLKERHVDDHALWINPNNNKHIIIGGDGGLYESFDRGQTWRFFENLPVTQFYRIQADNSEPFYYVYGGTQDNNSLGAPSRTTHTHGILNQDWFYLVGGDGYEPQIDPVDPNIIYAQWQYGNIVRYDKRSGELTGIQPQPEKEEEFRWNWDTPLIISPHNHKRLYVACNYVFRSDDRGDSWKRISDDVTRQINRDELPVMGKVWGPEAVAKNASTSFFGNTIALAESPVKENLLYVGTDDGLIHVTENAGETWTKYDKFPTVPETTYVSDVYPSRHSENVVYATFNNHKNNDFKPYVLKSTDKGRTWTSISGNLPSNGPVWTIEEDTKDPNILFVGTEFGVFVSIDGGVNWYQLKSGIPTISVRDLDIQERENDLVVGTFGRGIYILDDYSAIRQIKKENLEKEAYIFPIKDALMYLPDDSKSRRNEGETFFRADNPPIAAVIRYYLKESVLSKKEQRKNMEKELIDAGKQPPYPTIEQLKEEDEEILPHLLFTIKDSKGNIVRNLTAPPVKGINLINWDMRYSSSATPSANTKLNEWAGFPVLPGEYTVSMSLVKDGKVKELVSGQKIVCKPLNNVTLPADDKIALDKFRDDVLRLYGTTDATTKFLKELNDRIAVIKNTIISSKNSDLKFLETTNKIELELKKYKTILTGDDSKSKRNMNQTPSIFERIQYIVWMMWSSSSKPTDTQIKSFNIASSSLKDLLRDMNNMYNTDWLPLEKELDKLMVPWTPGRFPVWNE